MAIDKIKRFLVTDLSDDVISAKAQEIAARLEIADLDAISEAEAQMIATRIDQASNGAMIESQNETQQEPEVKPKKGSKTKSTLAKAEPKGEIESPQNNQSSKIQSPAPSQAYQEPTISLEEAVSRLGQKAATDVEAFSRPLAEQVDRWTDQVSDDVLAPVANAGKTVVAKVCQKAIALGADQDLEQFRGLGESFAAGIFPLR